MKLINFGNLYDYIENPLDNDKTMDKVIEAYSKCPLNGIGKKLLYTHLIQTVKKKIKGKMNVFDYNNFYAMMFNTWKKNVLSMTKNEFIELFKNNQLQYDFIQMRNYLKNIPDVKTKAEVDEIIYGKKGDIKLEKSLEKYRWDNFGRGDSWIHVCSKYVKAKKENFSTEDIEHRLYLDTECIDTHKMITYFVEKCEKYHIPYYFKFDEWGDRDDTIVIYSSTENLMKYMAILGEIKKEHPDLIARMYAPPMLAGNLDGWIGYGSEPKKINGKRDSFNNKRAGFLFDSITKVHKNWILSHLTMPLTYNNQKMNFQDYIAMKLTEKFLENLREEYSKCEERKKTTNTKIGKIYNEKEVIQEVGYTLNALNSLKVKQDIYNFVKGKIGLNISKVLMGKPSDMTDLTITFINGKTKIITGSDLMEVMMELTPLIAKNDPNFKKTLKNEIFNSSFRYGINANKFCFDISAITSMKNYDDKKENAKQSLSVKKEESNNKKIPNSSPNQTLKVNQPSSINQVSSQDIQAIYANYFKQNYDKIRSQIESMEQSVDESKSR